MAKASQVFETATAHPDWNADQIAEALDCSPSYVRTTFYRAGLPVPNKQDRAAFKPVTRCALALASIAEKQDVNSPAFHKAYAELECAIEKEQIHAP